jgi:ATP-binding cassette, subfamily F, member 3
VVLQVQNLAKAFGVTTVLEDVSFVVNDAEHVALVGPNGSGKSTVLRCLVGDEQPDRGSITLTGRIGYLPQSMAERDLHIPNVQLRFWEADHALRQEVTAVFDLGQLDPDQPLSGGQKTRLGLAAVLLEQPDLLILDEPTNHLDIDALKWLENQVNAWARAVLVVSHDRAFLDATVTRVLYLDQRTHSVSSYRGGYSDFAAARAHERAIHEDTWRRQQDYVSRVQRDIGRLKSEARSIEQSTTARQPGLRKFARKKAGVAKSRENKLERYLDSDERVDKPALHWPINLDFGTPPPGSRAVLQLTDVAFAYPGTAPLFEHVSFELRYGQRAAFVGPNGAGKTTLLHLIEGQLEPTHGQVHLGAGVRLGVLAQEHESLDLDLTVLETVVRERAMSEEDARSVLPMFLFSGDSVFRKVGDCSLGERSRLQLAQLVLRGCNLLLLDEPINHLDVESRDQFEAALHAFEGTIVVVAHDRAFLRAFARRTFEVRDGRVRLSDRVPAAPPR